METRPGLPPVKIFWSFVGSMRIWLKYIGRSLHALICFQVLPPSSERKTPLALGSGAGGTGAAPAPPRPAPPAPPRPAPPSHSESVPATQPLPPVPPPPPPPPR